MLFSLFQIHWEDLDRIEYILLKHLHLQPSELERLPFYRVEALIKNFKKDNEEEEKRRKKEEDEQKSKYNLGDHKKYMKDAKSGSLSKGGMPKMPKMPRH